MRLNKEGDGQKEKTTKNKEKAETILKTPNQVFKILPGENVTLTSAQETAKKVGIVLQIWGKVIYQKRHLALLKEKVGSNARKG